MVGPSHTRHTGRQRGTLGRDSRLLTEAANCLPNKRTRRDVSDKSNEVARRRINDSESRNWIFLRAGRGGKIPDRLQAHHSYNAVAVLFAFFCIDPTSHFLCLEAPWLFIWESHKAQGFGSRLSC